MSVATEVEAKAEAATKEIVAAPVPIKELCEKILQFCEAFAGKPLYNYQKEFGLRLIESLVMNDGDELTALFSRQSGKTETISCVISGSMVLLPKLAKDIEILSKFKTGVWVGLFAPLREQSTTTYDRVKDKFLSEFGKAVMADPEIEEDAKIVSGVLKLDNGSFLRAHSASKQTKVESKTYHILIVEEAQDADEDKVTRSIHPMGASTNATLVKVGTPGIHKGDFYKAIQRNIRARVRGKKRNHFEFDYKVCQRYNPNYKKYVKKEKERLGEDSDAFRMSYCLEWLLERGMFVTQDRLDQSCDIKLNVVTEKKTGNQVAGIDFGKHSDSTIVTILDMDETMVDLQGNMPKTILNWLEIEGDDYETQYQRVVDFLEAYNVSTVLCDATGVGDPIVDRLRYGLPRMAVIPITFTLPQKDKMYKYLHQEISNGRLKVPGHAKARRLLKWRRFKQQLLDLEKHYVGKYMTCKHPDVKDAHDDYCDSLALACWATREEVMPIIQEQDSRYLFGGAPIWR